MAMLKKCAGFILPPRNYQFRGGKAGNYNVKDKHNDKICIDYNA